MFRERNDSERSAKLSLARNMWTGRRGRDLRRGFNVVRTRRSLTILAKRESTRQEDEDKDGCKEGIAAEEGGGDDVIGVWTWGGGGATETVSASLRGWRRLRPNNPVCSCGACSVKHETALALGLIPFIAMRQEWLGRFGP